MNEMSIPWFYVWSPRYEIFHRILQYQLQDVKDIELHPMFVAQSVFTKKDKNSLHFLCGIGIKIYVLLKELKARPGQFIIFSDVDLIVDAENLMKELPKYKNKNIVCMRDIIGEEAYNIGFMLVKSTPDTIELFDSVLKKIMKENLLDQDVFNKEVSNWLWKDTVGFFDDSTFLQSNMLQNNKEAEKYCVIQALTSHSEVNNIIVEKLLTYIDFFDITSMRHLLPIEQQKLLADFAKQYFIGNPISEWKFNDLPVSAEQRGDDESSSEQID